MAVSATGPDALIPEVLDLLNRTSQSYMGQAMQAELVRSLVLDMEDDESNLTKLSQLYMYWCQHGYDLLFGPSRSNWNAVAVGIAKQFGKPIIIWSFEGAWYETGFGYQTPLHRNEAATTSVEEKLRFLSKSYQATVDAIMGFVFRRPPPQHQSEWDDLAAGEICDLHEVFLGSTSLNGSLVPEMPEVRLALELAHFDPISIGMAVGIEALYQKMLSHSKSHSAAAVASVDSQRYSTCAQMAMEEVNDVYAHAWDLNTPSEDLLNASLTQLYKEGKRSVVFVGEFGYSLETFRVFMGGIDIAQALNYSGIYAEHYHPGFHSTLFQVLDLLHVEVFVVIGKFAMQLNIINEVNVREWSFPPTAVICTTPKLMTLHGQSIAQVNIAAVTNYFLQTMPWWALDPSTYVGGVYASMGNFLNNVVWSDKQLEQVRAWQLSAALSIAYHVNSWSGDVRPTNATFWEVLCDPKKCDVEGSGCVHTEMGAVIFNCSVGSAGKRIDGPTSMRQLHPLDHSWDTQEIFFESQAFYVGDEPTLSSATLTDKSWWADFKKYYRNETTRMKSYEQKRIETRACERGYELHKIGDGDVADVVCEACNPGWYFNGQWLRCRPCNKANDEDPEHFTISEAALRCEQLSDVFGGHGAVFDTPETVPLASPGWYRVTRPDAEDARFYECPGPEYCLGNNTCDGNVVGMLCHSCQPGWQHWGEYSIYTAKIGAGSAEGYCYECRYGMALLRLVGMFLLWGALTALLSVWAVKDAFKVGAIRFASLRICIFNLQIVALQMATIPRQRLGGFFRGEMLTAPWEFTSVECFAALVWPGGTHEEWREFVINFKIFVSVAFMLVGDWAIKLFHMTRVFARMPQRMLTHRGPYGAMCVTILIILGPHGQLLPSRLLDILHAACNSAEVYEEEEGEEDGDDEEDGDGYGPRTSSNPKLASKYSAVSSSSQSLGLEAEKVAGDEEEAGEWPGYSTDLRYTLKQAEGSTDLRYILNLRSRLMEDAQRQGLAYIFLMNPIILLAVANRFSCTAAYGIPFRVYSEFDLECISDFSKLLATKATKWFLLLTLACPALLVVPLLTLYRYSVNANLRISNQRGLSVLLLGYNPKHAKWIVTDIVRMWLFVVLSYNYGDLKGVALRRLAWVTVSMTMVLLNQPYSKAHRQALLLLDVSWQIYIGLFIVVGESEGVSQSPDTQSLLAAADDQYRVLEFFLYACGTGLLIAQTWIAIFTTWDPNRYNIDNDEGTKRTRYCWMSLYLKCFKKLAGINPIVVGAHMGGTVPFIDLRGLELGQVHYFTSAVGDALLYSMEWQQNFAPTILYVILDEAFRRAAAGREALIESRANRHSEHWNGPYNPDYAFTLHWDRNADALEAKFAAGLDTIRARVEADKEMSDKKLEAFMETNMVMRDNFGHVVEIAAHFVPRNRFPLLVRIEANRSIAVEELATALTDVCIDVYEGEPSLCADIKTLFSDAGRDLTEVTNMILDDLQKTKKGRKKKIADRLKLRRIRMHDFRFFHVGFKHVKTAKGMGEPEETVAEILGQVGEPRESENYLRVREFMEHGDSSEPGVDPDALEDDVDEETIDYIATSLEVSPSEASFVLRSVTLSLKSKQEEEDPELMMQRRQSESVEAMETVKSQVFQRVDARRHVKQDALRHTLRLKLLELEMLVSDYYRRGAQDADKDMVHDCKALINEIYRKQEQAARRRRLQKRHTALMNQQSSAGLRSGSARFRSAVSFAAQSTSGRYTSDVDESPAARSEDLAMLVQRAHKHRPTSATSSPMRTPPRGSNKRDPSPRLSSGGPSPRDTIDTFTNSERMQADGWGRVQPVDFVMPKEDTIPAWRKLVGDTASQDKAANSRRAVATLANAGGTNGRDGGAARGGAAMPGIDVSRATAGALAAIQAAALRGAPAPAPTQYGNSGRGDVGVGGHATNSAKAPPVPAASGAAAQGGARSGDTRTIDAGALATDFSFPSSAYVPARAPASSARAQARAQPPPVPGDEVDPTAMYISSSMFVPVGGARQG